jgi:multidrug resistance efflux pump
MNIQSPTRYRHDVKTEPAVPVGLPPELEGRLSPGETEVSSTKDAPIAEVAQPSPSRRFRRIMKAVAGIAIVAVFGWLPLKALFQTSSVEAVVNSRLVTLRSPIDGKVASGSNLSGDLGILAEGTLILRVVNPRGDRVRLDDLRRQMSRPENERPSLVSKIAAAQTAQKDLARQAALFTEGRIRQLDARIAEIQTSIEAAAARREEATAAMERASTLVKSGSVSTVELGRLTRDRTIAQQNETGVQRRLDATQVELTAAREGSFLGDSYNDRPSSVQREEEMRQRAEGLTADLVQADAEISWLAGEIASEQIHYIGRSEALAAPGRSDCSRSALPKVYLRKWRGIESHLIKEEKVLERCRADADGCPSYAAGFLRLINAVKAKSGRAQFEEANRGVNAAIRFVTDF